MSPNIWLTVWATSLYFGGTVSSAPDNFSAADQGWSAPRIVEHPVSAVVARGQPVTLNCRAAGHPAAHITWLQNGRAVAGGRPDRLVLAPGSLFFLAAKERDAGVYRCRADSEAGEATSRNATMVVATLREEFRRSPRPTKTTHGSDVVLRCDPPRGHPEVTVRWLKNGDPLAISNRLRMERSDLYITDVQPTDAGDYVCQASNVLGVRRSRPAALSVLVSPYFVLRPSPGLGLAGGSLLLPCRVGGSPRPRVHWRRLDGALPVGRLHYTEDNSMRIDALRPSDAGQYSCEAENEAGRISAPVTVTVHVSPSVDAPGRKVVRLGSQAALKCQVRGQPVPRGVWWKETEFDPLLADQIFDLSFVQERGRITTSVQNDLYISPVTSDDLGWWVCAATSAAGSVVSRVLLHTGSRSRGHEAKVSGADSLHSELVHLEEVKVTGQNSVRLTWKTSDRRPVDGFYICYILLPSPDEETPPSSLTRSSQLSRSSHSSAAASHISRASPSTPQTSPAGNRVHRVTVLNGGAESYELTGLRAGAAYQLFLVPFRGGREGRLSRLREVRLPEAVPSAAPGDLSVTFTESETVITWSPLPPEVTNGRVTGYSVTVRSADHETPTLTSASASASASASSPVSASIPVSSSTSSAQLTNSAISTNTERTYHVSSPPLALAGRPTELRVRVAAVTAAGRGPFSPWWRAGDGAEAGANDSEGDGDGDSDGDGVREGAGEGAITGPPLMVTATVPRHTTAARLPTWLVAVLCCLGLFAIGGGVLALHCHRLRRKQSVLAGNTPAELADTKPPPSAHGFPPDSLSQNTLWLRDELFSKNVYATAERDDKDDRHVYVNGLSDSTVGGPTVGLYASARVVGSLGSVEGPGSPRPSLHRSLGSARMARRLHSLGMQSACSAPGVSAAPHSQPASPRLRHDRHRAPPGPLYSSGSYQECCCYECDYGRGRPPPLPPESPDVGQSDCDELCGCKFDRPAARRRRLRCRSSSGSGSAVDRSTQSSPPAAERAVVAPAAPYANGESSISDSSSSSLYAETDLNDMVNLGGAGELTELTAELTTTTPVIQQQRSSVSVCGRQAASRTHSLCSADSAYSTPGPSRHSFNTGDGGRPDRSLPSTGDGGRPDRSLPSTGDGGRPDRSLPSTGDGGRPDRNFPTTPTIAKPGRRRRSAGGSSEHVAYSAS